MTIFAKAACAGQCLQKNRWHRVNIPNIEQERVVLAEAFDDTRKFVLQDKSCIKVNLQIIRQYVLKTVESYRFGNLSHVGETV